MIAKPLTFDALPRYGRRRIVLSVLLASGLLLAGCEQLLEVESPSRLPAEDILKPSNAAILVNGAQSDFECALANFILAGGQVGDELAHFGGGSVNEGYDKRAYTAADPWPARFPCEGGSGSQNAISVWAPLQTARFAARSTEELLESWTDDEVPGRAEARARMAAFSGYSTLLLGEAYCTAAVDLGPELSRSDMFQLAEVDFTRAIELATSAGSASLLGLAQVGRARTRVNLGTFSEALTDARMVPGGFRFDARYSAASVRTENRVFRRMNRNRSVGVGPYYQHLEFQGVPDPRIPVTNLGLVPASQRTDSLWVQDLYPTESSPIPIATWQEAQLIISEAELDAGRLQEAVDAINVLHANANLPAFSSGDAAEIRVHLIEERRRQLFLQGNHLNDLIRFSFPLVPSPGTIFQAGAGEYGTMTCLPLPDVERISNPNIG